MKTAVCMKYVPVIARMRFDYEARTIIREGVPSEVNPFDVLGLVRAVELKTAPEDEVVVLTMGPPGAAEGLTECLALGADRGVLVTDRALAGSDTLATSRRPGAGPWAGSSPTSSSAGATAPTARPGRSGRRWPN